MLNRGRAVGAAREPLARLGMGDLDPARPVAAGIGGGAVGIGASCDVGAPVVGEPLTSDTIDRPASGR